MTGTDDLALDLRDAVDDLAGRANVCRLVSLADLEELLPARRLGAPEARQLLAALADAGLDVVEPNAVERLAAEPPG